MHLTDNLKKQSGSFSELLGSYGITKDTRNRAYSELFKIIFNNQKS